MGCKEVEEITGLQVHVCLRCGLLMLIDSNLDIGRDSCKPPKCRNAGHGAKVEVTLDIGICAVRTLKLW